MARELKVISDCYELMQYMLERIDKFPRGRRFGLGTEIERRLQWVLALLIRAKHDQGDGRRSHLREANVELEVLRFQIRLAKDVAALPLKSHGHAVQLMEQVGAQVGGWLRATGQVRP